MKFLVLVQVKQGINIRLWIRKFKKMILSQMNLNYKKVRHLITGNSFKMNKFKRLNKKIELTKNNHF